MEALSYYDYLMQHKGDPVGIEMFYPEDKPFLQTIKADTEGFAKMVNYWHGVNACMTFVFDVFLNSWGNFYKTSTGRFLY